MRLCPCTACFAARGPVLPLAPFTLALGRSVAGFGFGRRRARRTTVLRLTLYVDLACPDPSSASSAARRPIFPGVVARNGALVLLARNRLLGSSVALLATILRFYRNFPGAGAISSPARDAAAAPLGPIIPHAGFWARDARVAILLVEQVVRALLAAELGFLYYAPLASLRPFPAFPVATVPVAVTPFAPGRHFAIDWARIRRARFLAGLVALLARFAAVFRFFLHFAVTSFLPAPT